MFTWMRNVIVFAAAAALVAACTCPIRPKPSPTDTSQVGWLDVDINYTDDFYREIFGYTRDAENIRHYVLIMPESEASEVTTLEVFLGLNFPGEPAVPLLREDAGELSWVVPYLHEAPEGRFSGEFVPGQYEIAVVFLAAPVSREEADVGEDVILYPGVTGGGASTDFQPVVIEAGGTVALTITMTDANGWACPWLYVFNGRQFERRTEILRNLRGRQNERTEVSRLDHVTPVDGVVVLKVAEEKNEITWIDALYVLVDGVAIQAEADSVAAASVAAADQDYLIITQGEAVELRFRLPAAYANRQQVSVSVVVTGFYVPVE